MQQTGTLAHLWKISMAGLRFSWLNADALSAVALAAVLIAAKNVHGKAGEHLLNVSYDPTRELYRDLDFQFIARHAVVDRTPLDIRQSHGGSSRQARLSISGELQPDVVT